MEYIGKLLKMKTDFNNPVEYSINFEEKNLLISNYVDRWITIKFSGDIHCINCGKKTYKSFSQGYCYPCFISVPETSECIMRPELCRAHEGESRDMDWSKKHCLTSQYVYLSLTSGVKVGVTREKQLYTRWIDQGAVQAIKLAKTPNRYIAGLIELEMKKIVSDRTAWQRMLKNDIDTSINLLEKKNELVSYFSQNLKKHIDKDNNITNIFYPIHEYPQKIISINLDKEYKVSGQLTGIKGQYLFFDNERVLNIRKYQGYRVQIST